MKMLKDMEWDTVLDVDEISKIIENDMDLFKNAGGDIETYLGKCKMVHTRRVFTLGDNHKFILTHDDLKNGLEEVKKHRIDKEENPEKIPDSVRHLYT